jgi:hypothetical protein
MERPTLRNSRGLRRSGPPSLGLARISTNRLAGSWPEGVHKPDDSRSWMSKREAANGSGKGIVLRVAPVHETKPLLGGRGKEVSTEMLSVPVKCQMQVG